MQAQYFFEAWRFIFVKNYFVCVSGHFAYRILYIIDQKILLTPELI
jgi:hypothetical protein